MLAEGQESNLRHGCDPYDIATSIPSNLPLSQLPRSLSSNGRMNLQKPTIPTTTRFLSRACRYLITADYTLAAKPVSSLLPDKNFLHSACLFADK